MGTADDIVTPMQKKLDSLFKSQRDLILNIREHDTKLFIDRGGCNECLGRGWVVIWDTLDCMHGSYAQYGSCTNESCTHETRAKSGQGIRSSKYDRNRGTCVEPVGSADQILEKHSLDNQISDLKSKIDTTYLAWKPEKGKLIKIIKAGSGPKSKRQKVGTVGIVIKKWVNDWGTEKLIVLDDDGNKHWPSVKQVEVLDPTPDPAMFERVLQKDRERNGFPVIVTIKAMSGKAALVLTTNGKEKWTPFSQVPELRSAKKGDTLSVILPTWFVNKNNLI